MSEVTGDDSTAVTDGAAEPENEEEEETGSAKSSTHLSAVMSHSFAMGRLCAVTQTWPVF